MNIIQAGTTSSTTTQSWKQFSHVHKEETGLQWEIFAVRTISQKDKNARFSVDKLHTVDKQSIERGKASALNLISITEVLVWLVKLILKCNIAIFQYLCKGYQ